MIDGCDHKGIGKPDCRVCAPYDHEHDWAKMEDDFAWVCQELVEARAQLERRENELRAAEDKRYEAEDQLAAAQAEIVELRRVLGTLFESNDDAFAGVADTDASKALASPTVAQPLLDAVRMASEVLDSYINPNEHPDSPVERAFDALAPWVPK